MFTHLSEIKTSARGSSSLLLSSVADEDDEKDDDDEEYSRCIAGICRLWVACFTGLAKAPSLCSGVLSGVL